MDIRHRADLDGLLRAFYARVFDDPLLARIFVDVAHMDLEEHLPAIGDFWEKVLFNTAVYNGRAMEVHRRLHRREPLTGAHFSRWVQLWDDAVDARHDGPVAELAKAHAARIAVGDAASQRTELPFGRRRPVLGEPAQPTFSQPRRAVRVPGLSSRLR